MPRHPAFTQEIADTICDRIALGESLREICAEDEMPDQTTIYRWLRRDDEIGESFRQQYARAREDQADTMVDECKVISDDGTNDWMEKHDKDGKLIGWQLNGEHVQRSKLRIEQRRWHAAKLKPKKYGEKLDLTSDNKPLGEGMVDASTKIAALLEEARRKKMERGGE